MADDTTREPLSEARLTEIHADFDFVRAVRPVTDSSYERRLIAMYEGDVSDLLAERERLRAELEDARGDAAFLARSRDTAAGKAAAAMEIVRAVAAGRLMCLCGMLTLPVAMPANSQALPYSMTTVVDVHDIRHREDCPIAQARELLAPTEGASEGEPQP